MAAVPLSIVIPTHHRTDLLRRCLRSIVEHAPARTEVIVVADGTPVEAGPGVRVIRLSRRRGFCAAANTGIAAASGGIVELLNDDTEVTAGWAEAALACFADQRVAAVAPLVVLASRERERPESTRTPVAHAPGSPEAVIDSAGDGYDPGGFARKLGHGQPLTAAHLCRREVFGASGSSAFYRRDLLRRVGGFPEQFGAYFEDIDLAFRLRRTGGVILFEPASLVVHHGGSSYRPGRRLIEQQSCNEERVWWRNLPTRDLIRSLPRHVAVLAAKAARRCREGNLLPWTLGRVRAWSEVVHSRRHEARLGTGPSPFKLHVTTDLS